MGSYLIYTDSAADLEPQFFEKYDIRVIPMDYMLDGQPYTFDTSAQDRDRMCEELYAGQRNKKDVHTSQIVPFRYEECWTPELQAGLDILYICFSSGMSATYMNALSAVAELKEEFPERKIEVVDSLAATSGEGLFALVAGMNREKGMSLEENAAWLREHAKYVCHRFTVGDLDYLHRGGRVSATVAIIGGILNIRPMLIIDDEGKLQMVGKARGKNAAFKSLVQGYQKELGAPDMPNVCCVSHTGQYEDAERLRQMVLEIAPEGTIVELINVTPIIAAHTGPDFFAVIGFGKHRKES